MKYVVAFILLFTIILMTGCLSTKDTSEEIIPVVTIEPTLDPTIQPTTEPTRLHTVVPTSAPTQKPGELTGAAPSKVIDFFASSYIDYENMYIPSVVFDNNPLTGWLESARGPGIGEYIGLEFSRPITIDEIKIMPGYFDQKWWAANNRVKKLEIILGDFSIHASFQDIMKTQRIKLPQSISFKKGTFIIKDVYLSEKDNDAGIAEIGFYYKGKRIDPDVQDNDAKEIIADDWTHDYVPPAPNSQVLKKGYFYHHVWSPDGEKIAYTISSNAYNISTNLHLVVANKDLSDPRIIYTGVNKVQISWQGEWILFEMDKEEGNPGDYYGAQEYWKIKPDGSELTQLTFTFTNKIKSTENGHYINCGSARWSGFVKGTNLIFFQAHDGNGWYKSYVCNADGTDRWREISGVYTGTAAVSPLGTKLLYMIGSNYNTPHTIKAKNVNGTGEVTIAHVSARGYFFVNADDSKVIWHDNDDIYTADMDGENYRPVITRARALNPTSNPDEILCKKIADDGRYHIFKVNLKNSVITQLTSGDYEDHDASVNPVHNIIAVKRFPVDSDMSNLEVIAME